MKFQFEREENIVGRGENAGYQHFYCIADHIFKRPFTSGP